jgi:hypothetical protein
MGRGGRARQVGRDGGGLVAVNQSLTAEEQLVAWLPPMFSGLFWLSSDLPSVSAALATLIPYR